MRKHDIMTKSGARLRQIGNLSQATLDGAINSLVVPQVKAGAYIDITLNYWASNTEGSLLHAWKIFVVAKDNLGNKELVKDADVRAATFTDSGNWRLWQMPGQAIRLEVRLYALDAIEPWDWSWWV